MSVAPYLPITRGLKEVNSPARISAAPGVAPYLPITRGLKEEYRQQVTSQANGVAPYLPITRGLKGAEYIQYGAKSLPTLHRISR